MPRITVTVSFIILICFLAAQIEADVSYKVIITRLKMIEHDPNICVDPIMKTTPQRGKSASISASCFIPVAVHKFYISFNVLYKFKVYRDFLISGFFEVCEIVDGKKRNIYFEKLAPILQQGQNFIHPCPYIGREGLYNYTLDAGLLALAIPAGQYRVDYRVYMDNNHTVVAVQIFFIIKSIGIADLSFK